MPMPFALDSARLVATVCAFDGRVVYDGSTSGTMAMVLLRQAPAPSCVKLWLLYVSWLRSTPAIDVVLDEAGVELGLDVRRVVDRVVVDVAVLALQLHEQFRRIDAS